jgi:hypothetical protein
MLRHSFGLDASSDRMSPNMFSVTMTSNWAGSRINCIAELSTSWSMSSTSGYSTATRCTTSRHRRDVSSTFALSTLCTRLRLVSAASNATRAMRSISYSR